MFIFPDDNDSADEYCYTVDDIAHYVHGKFRGRKNVRVAEISGLLDLHPVFPSEGFMKNLKGRLREIYGDSLSRVAVSFTDDEARE